MKALAALTLVVLAGCKGGTTCHPICQAGFRPTPDCGCAPIAAPSASASR